MLRTENIEQYLRIMQLMLDCPHASWPQERQITSESMTISENLTFIAAVVN